MPKKRKKKLEQGKNDINLGPRNFNFTVTMKLVREEKLA